MRHSQLPPTVPGKFIRASPPRCKKSCMGTMAVSATEAKTHSIIASQMFSALGSVLRASSFTGSAALSHQPCTVSLSCVPV